MVAGTDAGSPPPTDAAEPPDSNYDPVAGNAFEGDLIFDDARMMRLDGDMLRAGSTPCRAPVLARVYHVFDGDTIEVTALDGSLDKHVRLIGVDTPEIAHSPTPADCYGPEASVFTQQLQDHLVWLTFDNDCEDRYGRLLAYVHIGGGSGDFWERQLLRRGFATVLTVGSDRSFRTEFESDEAAARAANVGLWSACR